MIKKDSENKQEINIETYLKIKKITKENIENLNIDILICLQKRKKD